MNRCWQTCRARLQRLRTAYLAAIIGNSGIIRHILRLKRRDRKPLIGEITAQSGNQNRFPDIRSGTLNHQTGGCFSAHLHYPPSASSPFLRRKH
jgi:hypothetical protein